MEINHSSLQGTTAKEPIEVIVVKNINKMFSQYWLDELVEELQIQEPSLLQRPHAVVLGKRKKHYALSVYNMVTCENRTYRNGRVTVMKKGESDNEAVSKAIQAYLPSVSTPYTMIVDRSVKVAVALELNRLGLKYTVK